ncbi:hypothetical protein Bra3105_18425 (plasmid) [Brachybacterium halotolerans subsp. kimchii]|uniref:hypothetical protein n=1 Tax=Brachybacterium halotolerans TaxID=2795215 RepID=UPI001E3850CB|nr:hypothetical protein [Brachybacterium halotolerans]UEJ84608.1 hypothetical protein Bra3105_18425 [Brachybacterium halotolerans subsp. kimchii]
MIVEPKDCSGLKGLGPTCVGKGIGEKAHAVFHPLEALRDAVVEAYEHAISAVGTIWVYVPTPNLTGGSSESPIDATETPPGSGSLETVLSYFTWIALALAIASLIALGARMAVTRRNQGEVVMGRLGYVFLGVALIGGASSLVGGLLPSQPNAVVGGTVMFLQSSLWWFMGAACLASIIVAAIRMVWTQRGEAGKELVQSLLTLLVVAGAGTSIIALLVKASDAGAVWILEASLDCDLSNDNCFSSNMSKLIVLTASTGGIGALLVIILGLIAVLCSIIQIALMFLRSGMLVVLTGIFPLASSATNTEMGRTWFKRCVGWLVAAILYKPAAAVVYAAAFRLSGTNVKEGGDAVLQVVSGVMLMILALVALPALMRFVTPLVSQSAGGAAGGLAMGAAMAALPMGASAAGRLMGAAKGAASKGTAPTGAPSSTSQPAGSKSEGSSSPGGQGPAGSSQSSTGGPGNSGGNGPAGSKGESTTGKTGSGTQGSAGPAGSTGAGGQAAGAGAKAGGSAAAAGGGGAAAAGGGGAVAAGAAAGPAGMAAGAAVEVGKKVGQAGKAAGDVAKGAADDVTGEGGGPSGSGGN